MFRSGGLLAIAVGVLSICIPAGAAVADEMTAAEQRFSDSMRDATLVGFFTMDGQDEQPLKPERYEIASAVKASGQLWIFTVRIKYGKIDTKLPVTVPLVWAGDTPMVNLKNASIPGLGAGFSARVLFDGEQYAGTWKHGKVGGHMFGRIERGSQPPAGDSRTRD